jgi:hypothetical protein
VIGVHLGRRNTKLHRLYGFNSDVKMTMCNEFVMTWGSKAWYNQANIQNRYLPIETLQRYIQLINVMRLISSATVHIKMFWVGKQCSRVGRKRRFGGTCYLHLVFFFSFSGWGETESTWYVGQCFPIVPAPDDRWWSLWSSWWNEGWQGKPKYSEKTCPSATLSTTNPTWPGLG